MADDAPNWDDIPSWDNLPDAGAKPSEPQSAAPAWDDIPSWDDLPDQHERPKAEGPIASNVRAVAHGIVPAGGAAVGMGAGAALGSAILPGVGTLVGGVIGGIAGGMGADVLQDKAQENIPAIDDRAQMAADQEKYPVSTTASGMLPFAGNPGKLAGSIAQRLAGGAMLGGLDVAQQEYQKGDVDPKQALAAGAFGAVFPHGNKVVNAIADKAGAAAGKVIPGRPGKVANNPDAAQAHADVGDQSVPTTAGDVAPEESPLGETGETVGARDDNKPTNSQGEVATGKADPSYAKTQPAAGDQSQMSTGDIAPDIQSALGAANEETPAAAPPPPPPPPPPSVNPAAAQVNTQKPRISLKRPPPEQVVDTGIPETGEPVAMGENDATPMPAGMPERAAAAIKQSKAAQPVEKPRVWKDDTAPNDTISQAQKDAGNYQKMKANDFGKPMRVETKQGDIRRSHEDAPEPWENVSPNHYGYYGKTKSTDGEGIDFNEPAEGSPERGNKHFIVDQKDLATGKYDEPKVYQYVKDEATARDLYNRGFGDGKGPARLHDITEVDRPGLVKYLAEHTTKAPTKPYGQPIEKPLREREGVKAAAEKLRAQGNIEGANALSSAPDEALAGKVEGLRARKYGVKGGYPVEGLVNDVGEPVTAKDKKLAASRSAAHKAVSDWFEKSAPKDSASETNGQLLDRLKGHPYPGPGAWAPTFKPKEWMLAKAARDTLKSPTPGSIQKFRDAERMLRGSPEAVDTYRGGNRVEADIARSHRSGDEAIQRAENEATLPGRNTEEEKMLENIGRQRGDFDVPHEEAEEMVKPRKITTPSDIKERAPKEVDMRETKLAEAPKSFKKPVAKMSLKELTEGKPEATKKEEFKPAEAATLGESVKGKFSAEDMKRMVELSNKAAGRKGLSDDEIRRMDFLRDESGAVGGPAGAARRAAVKGWLAKMLSTTPVKSYRAKDISSPTNKYVNDLFDEMHLKDNLSTMHKQENIRKSQVLDREADRASLERIYKAREADSAHVDLPGKQAGKTNIESLSPADKKVWDEHLKPMSDEVNEFKDLIRKLDPDRMGPDVEHYIARITKGDTSEYNMLRAESDPTGPQYKGLGVNAGMAKERAFSVLERKSDGKRFVVMNRPNGFTLWENQKGIRIKDPSYAFEANSPYQVKGKKGTVDYTMRHATADEIERSGAKFDLGNGKTQLAKYHQNAGLSVLLAHTKLGEMARNLQELARIASTKEFQDRTTRNSKDAEERGYKETIHPNFKGTYMDPRLARLMDDYAKPGFDSPQIIRDLNQAVTKLLFWMPTAHIANVGTHWVVGRGFDWATPHGWARLAKTAPRAIKSVIMQDARQQRYNATGAGTVYPSVQTRNFIDTIAKNVGEEMQREPSKWGPVADAFGVPLGKLSKAIYDNSSKVMWAANDMFLTQRIMELEMKGHSTDQAIKMAERDIPNYRVPPQLFSGAKNGKGAEWGRFASQVMQDPAVSSFGRYHVGMFTSYANIFKDVFSKNSSVGDRVDAAGKLMAMAVLAYAVYPALDKMSQYITGNEHAEQNRRGPIAIPTHLVRAAQGKEDIASAGRSTLTIPPFWSTVLETLSNKDFRGKAIVEPGDIAAGFKGNAYRGGKALVQEGEHAARGLISPLGTFATAEKKSTEPGAAGVAKATGRAIRDQAVDVKNPSQNAIKFQQKQGVINEKNARQRDKKGGYGPLEEGYKKVFGGN